MSPRRLPRNSAANAGFTLIEVLVAFTILLVGMAGIITAFSAGLTLEQEGRTAFEGGFYLDELRPLVRDQLIAKILSGQSGDLKIARSEVPGRPGLFYEATARAMPGDSLGYGYLVKIDVIAPRPGGDRRESSEFSPMILAPSQQELIRKALAERR